jgi:hypothetical protein
MMTIKRGALALAALVLVTGCSGADPEEPEPADPYEVYVENNPPGQKLISREDAQARAYLGCGMKFAPGTVDYVLREAYKPDCPRDDN